MLDQILLSVINDLHACWDEDKDLSRKCTWVIDNALILFQQYPSGISRAVLLTELEHKWRVSKKRGDHVGKIKQTLSSMQISLSDLIYADIARLDDNRCTLSADGATCMLIIHRQWFDWIMFLCSVGVDALTGRCCILTHCRLLNIDPPILLPTPMAIFCLREEDPLEAFLLKDILFVMYKNFWDRHIAPVSSLHGGGVQQMPNNTETLVVIVEVLENGPLRRYGDNGGAGQSAPAGSGADFQMVTLRVLDSAARKVGGSGSKDGAITYLILFDDQVALSQLWHTGDRLVVYRPYFRSNFDETYIFGGRRVSTEAHTLAYQEVRDCDPALTAFATPNCPTLPFHLLYGSVTVISKVDDTVARLTLSPALSAVGGPAAVSVTSAIARILSCIVLPTDVVEMWAHTLPISSVTQDTQEASHQQQLLCIRCHVSQFEAWFGPMWAASFCLSNNSPHQSESSRNRVCNTDTSIDYRYQEGAQDCLHTALSILPVFSAGQCVRFTGIKTITKHSLATACSSSSPSGGAPTAVHHYLHGLGSFGVGAEVVFCTISHDFLDQAHDLFRNKDCGDRPVIAPNNRNSVKILNISRLIALACSPSLVQPMTLLQASAVRGSAAAGSVLVCAANVQPMHPSVRLCQRFAGCGVSPNLRLGYQIMRLRDDSGEVLCVLESTVLVGTSSASEGKAPELIERVRHHLINTSSNILFDACSGQLTRLVPAVSAQIPTPQSQPCLALLLSRIDDGVNSAVMEHILSLHAERSTMAPRTGATLPCFRIDAICDAIQGHNVQQNSSNTHNFHFNQN